MRLSRAICNARKQIAEKQEELSDLETTIGPALVSEFKEWDKQNPGFEKYSSNYKDIKRTYAPLTTCKFIVNPCPAL